MNLYEKKYNGKNELSLQGAFRVKQTISFKLYIPRRCGAVSVRLHLFGEGISDKSYKIYNLSWETLDNGYDIYFIDLNMLEIGIGLYYYKYEVISNEIKFYGKTNEEICLQEIKSNNGLIQLLIYQEDKKPEWIYGGIMYHIFVDRFFRSGKCLPKNNIIMNEDWNNGIPQYADVPGGYVENNMFFGGDLYGIIEKLDYIKSLGVNCLYLSPIFDAYSNHKYDTGDYMTIDSMFGGENALDELIKAAKEKDIHIILDGVFNHTGADSIYFNKNGNYNTVGAFQSKKSKYYDWYNFKNYPDDYECWWNVKILPRVKSDTPSYKEYILGDGGVIEKWMKKGISGFRLDVADELSDEFLSELNCKLKSIKPDGIIYGEVWEDASNKIAYDKRKKYFLGNELDSVMNYPLREAIIEYIKNGNSDLFVSTCNTLYTHYPKSNTDALMNVLGTHDTERILTVLGGDSSKGLSNAELSIKKMNNSQLKQGIDRLKLAYTILATVPGVPCIYYGDEVGMEGYRDPFNRRPFPWGRENKELLEHYKQLGKIRTKEPLYKEGHFDILKCDSDILIFARYDDNQFVLSVINRSNNIFEINSNLELKNLATNRKITKILPNTSYVLKSVCKYKSSNIKFIKNH